MIVNFELNDQIYHNLESNADERGITLIELCRWIIGEFSRFNNPPSLTVRGPVAHSSLEQENTKMTKLANSLIKSMIAGGVIKCPNCTLALTIKDIEQDKCSNCEADL